MDKNILFYNFGEFRMNGTGTDLEQNGERIAHLDGKPLQLLHLLVDRAPNTVSKTEFLDKIWRDSSGKDIHVGEANVAVNIGKIRTLLGEESIETKRGIGYRFAWPVTRTYTPGDPELFLVPYSENPFFTGRAKLLQAIHDRLEDNLQHGPIFLSGPQGIGKTQTALAYAYQYKEAYKYVLWFTCDDESTLLSQYCSMAGYLHLREASDNQQHLIRDAVRLWIDHHSPWLLVFDNVEDQATLESFLPRTHGALIITTRSDDVPTLRRERVGPLSAQDAKTFLLNRSGRSLALGSPELEYLEALALELGYFPLALEQAGAFLSATAMSHGAYLQVFRKNPIDLLSVPAGNIGQYGMTTMRAWQLTMASLSVSAKALLSVISLCEADQIPLKLLRDIKLDGSSFARLLPFELTIAELRRFSLVTVDVEKETANIHRLLQIIVSGSMESAPKQSVLLGLLGALDDHLPESPNAQWDVFDSFLPHSRKALLLADQEGVDSPAVAAVAAKCGGYLIARGRYLEALRILDVGLASANRQWPDGHATTATLLNGLGNDAFYQGRFSQAEAHYISALQIRERLLKADDPAVATTLNNLATVYLYQGRYSESESLFARALAHRQKVKGASHPDVATTMCNLANLYHAQGKFDQADAMYSEALRIRRDANVHEELLSGWILTNYAELKLDQAEPTSAVSLLKEALRIFTARDSIRHPYALMARHNLAKAHCVLGTMASASAEFESVIRDRIELFGASHPDLAFSYLELGAMRKSHGITAMARGMMYKANTMLLETLGFDHPRTLLSSIRLAVFLATQGEKAKAAELYAGTRPKIDALRERDGSIHPDFQKYVELYETQVNM